MLKDTAVSQFLGLHNVSDPLRLPLGALTTANNVNITDRGAIEPRAGHAVDTAGNLSGAYTTIDHQRLYVVDGGSLKTRDGTVLATGLSSDWMYWAEVNEQVYFANGTDYGLIEADNTVKAWSWPIAGAPTLAAISGSLPPGLYRVMCTFVLPDGRETGAGLESRIDIGEGQALQISAIAQQDGMSTRVYIAPANSTVFQLAASSAPAAINWDQSPDALGLDLTTDEMDPIPSGSTVIQAWRGRIYAAQYLPDQDKTAIWVSRALGFHLFHLAREFKMVNGRVLMLAPHDQALLIGTNKAIHAFDGTSLSTLAEYGVVPGLPWATDDSTPGKPVLIWSVRGACRFPEFANLTDKQVSVAPGVHVGAAVVQADGQRRFVAVLHQGGTAFNKRI